MTAQSFLSPATIARLQAVSVRGFATRLALAGGGTDLILARWSGTQQDWIALPAQTVLVTWGTTSRQNVTESAETLNVDGWLEKTIPFDVEIGDLFSLGEVGQEMRAKVTLVLPPNMGIQRAGFTVDPEERTS